MATFYDRFNTLYEESELSQEEFGSKFGASKGQVFNWRSRRGQPDTEMLKDIAAACSVSVDWLVGNGNLRTTVAEVSSNIEAVKKEKALELIEEFRGFIQLNYQVGK